MVEAEVVGVESEPGEPLRLRREAKGPSGIGIVLFATPQGIATIINSNIVKPELLDDFTGTAVDQFLRGARPIE
ncbi:hypothetical protein ACQP1O_19060 [Nocardia sp. CA-151230]|uniref:hypothetical protein n=1 Tax=Nocardia sp. CA-151230 TaxID=3239982 RepID=UPI003D93C707